MGRGASDKKGDEVLDTVLAHILVPMIYTLEETSRFIPKHEQLLEKKKRKKSQAPAKQRDRIFK